MQKKIKAVSDSQTLFGRIEILDKKDKKAHVIWSIFDEKNNLIASLTNNYFLGDRYLNDNEIFELVVNQMLKYRIGRKKKFTSVEFYT